MKSNIQQLSYALDLSDQILSAIADESLETISELDNERRLLINKYYKNNKTIDEKLTRELKLKNDLIVSQLVDMQQKTRSQQIKLNQSKKVSKAYLDNA